MKQKMFYEELCAAGEKLTGLGGDFEIIETEVRGVIQTIFNKRCSIAAVATGDRLYRKSEREYENGYLG